MELKTKYNIGDEVYFVLYGDEEYYDKENGDYYLEEKPYDVCKGKIVHICMNYKNEIDSYKLYVQEYGTYNWADNVYSTKEEAMIELKRRKKMTHELKILECYANAKVAGDKLFEIRNNLDRGFQKGDIVKYKVVDIYGIRYDHEIENKMYEITYVTNYEQKDGWVVFGEREVQK